MNATGYFIRAMCVVWWLFHLLKKKNSFRFFVSTIYHFVRLLHSIHGIHQYEPVCLCVYVCIVCNSQVQFVINVIVIVFDVVAVLYFGFYFLSLTTHFKWFCLPLFSSSIQLFLKCTRHRNECNDTASKEK